MVKENNTLLRLLFPEILLLKHIREVGFFNKKLFKKDRIPRPVKVKPITITQTKDVDLQTFLDGDLSTLRPLTQTAAGGSAPAETTSSSTCSLLDQGSKSRQEIDRVFNQIEKELPTYVIGQNAFLQKLTIAFKRPYVAGKEQGVRGLLFITGPKGSGRHTAVSVITHLLQVDEIFASGQVHTVDLSDYQTQDDVENLFLPDFYRALYGEEKVILLDNYDKTHSAVLDLLTQFGIEEKLELKKQYKALADQMVDVSGSLGLNAVNQLEANGKFFILITEKNAKKIETSFSNPFIQKIDDILVTKPLEDDELMMIAEEVLKDYCGKITKQLHIKMERNDADVLPLIIRQMNKQNGAHAIEEHIETYLYQPLVELELQKQIQKQKSYILSSGEEGLQLSDGTQRFILADYTKTRKNTALDELDQELSQIVGLTSVKEFICGLEDNLKVQKIREEKGQGVAKRSLHMIFTGNPGTGKTTMARMVAKYLKTLGYLSSGHLVEVSRGDLVGQYVGETAQKTIAKIQAAMGGILFIDEAYALARDENDQFGIEAVDTIVKAMEDYRDDLVMIFAGYAKEMEQFLKTNSGLKSRVNYIIDFPDYLPQELFEIAKIIAKSNGYVLAPEAEKGLLAHFEKTQIKGRNDAGNGRMARNVIEQAIAKQGIRLSRLEQISDEELNQLIPGDFFFDRKAELDLEKELSKVVGLKEVKDFIRSLQKQLVAQEKRKQAGITTNDSQSLNMIFLGNPGTGKTMIARLIADLMQKMGVLKGGQLVETNRNDLVSEYVGKTAKQTTDVFMSALGGVLFIDEAYSLMSHESDSVGKETVDTLVKLIEDYRNEVVVILAGYSKEMHEFLKTNSGLQSRFPLQIAFPDYSVDELVEIGKRMIAEKGFELAGNAEDELMESIQRQRRGQGSGNARLVRNLVEDLIRKQSARIADLQQATVSDLITVGEADFTCENEEELQAFDLEAQLDAVVGLNEVKDFIRSLKAQLMINEQRKLQGLPVSEAQTLHMIFTGNPGTGKTMMARIIGELFYSMGILRTQKFVETDRSGLVAGYVGQTAIKTKEKIEEALGGILFIDEAYALAQDAGHGQGFGKEAIDTLVKEMDDHREHLVVILAGYTEDMQQFIDTNPGLKSRFANVIEYADYSPDELMKIAEKIFTGKGFTITDGARDKILQNFRSVMGSHDFGNGRYVRNLFEKAVRQQAVRLQHVTELTREHLVSILAEDIENLYR